MGPIRSSTDIVAMQEEVRVWVEAKGWNEDDRSFGDELMLIVSEAAEALEAYREVGFERKMTPPASLVAEIGFEEAVKSFKEKGLLPKPDDVQSEIADIMVRLLDTCARHGWDLGIEFRRKMDYNWTRSHRHGGKRL